MEPIRAIACNLHEATKVFPKGALAYVRFDNPGNAFESVQIVGRSYGGRWVSIFQPIHRLHNFRLKTIMPGMPGYDLALPGETEERAGELNRAADAERARRVQKME